MTTRIVSGSFKSKPFIRMLFPPTTRQVLSFSMATSQKSNFLFSPSLLFKKGRVAGGGGESEKPPAYIRKEYFRPKGGITFAPFTQLMEEIGSTKESEQAKQLKIPKGDRAPVYPHIQIN